MIITFSGSDGSGKTTLIKMIESHIQSDNIADVLITEEFNTPLIRLIKGILDTLTHQKTITNNTKGKKKYLYYILVWVDYLILVLYHKIFSFNKIVLIDRYYYDYAIGIKEAGIKNKFVNFLFSKCFIQADLSFIILVNPTIAKKRHSIKVSLLDTNTTHIYDNTFYDKKAEIIEAHISNQSRLIRIDNNGDASMAEGLIYRIIRLKRARSVVITGIDGAGKSTTIENLKKELESYGIKYVQIHFYYNYIVLKVLKKIKNTLGIDAVKNKEVIYRESVAHEKKAKNQKKSSLWKYLVLIDALIQYGWIHLIGVGKIKLIDRGFLDYMVSWDFLGVKYNKNIFKYLPKPDNYFLLIAPPEVLYSRKPEHTEEFFIECHQKYMELAKEYDINIINTSELTESAVVCEITKNIQ